MSICLFFFNDTATTEIYTLSLHDALPIYDAGADGGRADRAHRRLHADRADVPHPHGAGDELQPARLPARSEEHTSELQSRQYLVCRLLLEKKKKAETVRPDMSTRRRHLLM